MISSCCKILRQSRLRFPSEPITVPCTSFNPFSISLLASSKDFYWTTIGLRSTSGWTYVHLLYENSNRHWYLNSFCPSIYLKTVSILSTTFLFYWPWGVLYLDKYGKCIYSRKCRKSKNCLSIYLNHPACSFIKYLTNKRL